MVEPTYYAVIYKRQPDGSWTAALLDFPEVVVTGADIDVVKGKITTAGKNHLERLEHMPSLLKPRGEDRAVVGYVHLRPGGTYPWSTKRQPPDIGEDV